MPEGRTLYNGSTFTQEYIITDQQGNARVSFNNTGTSGTVKVVQENSYYAFGLIMPGSTVPLPTSPNKNLYNGGSEWQNDFGNLPDYQQTFFRNYDAAIARWVAVDPVAESAESMTSYQYAGDNPVMNNDPMGNSFYVADVTEDPQQQAPNHSQDFNQWENNAILEGAGGLYTADPAAYWELYYSGGLKALSTNVYTSANGNLKQSDILAPYIGQDVWFAADGTLMSANLLPAGDETAFSAHQLGSTSMQSVLTIEQLFDLALLNQALTSADRGGNALNASDIEEDVDKSATIAQTIGLANKTVALINKSSAFEVLGKLTGAITLVNNARKTYNAYNNGDKAGAIKYAFLTVGQGAAMAVGEEFELAWNATTLVYGLFDNDSK
jgi:RHS repeat-associated protein